MANKTLTKPEFVDVIAAQEGIKTKKEAAKVINAFIAGVKTVLANKDNLTLSGFEKYTVEHKPAQKRFFGITQDVIEVPAHDVYKSKLSKSLLNNI